MTSFRRLTPHLGWGEPLPAQWQRLTAVRMLILVGLTGVGKTTTVKALETAGLDFKLLPNRRALTDELIIGIIQDQWGEPRYPIADRGERFAYTRQYRQKYPGGMAHALSQVAVNVEATGNPAWWLFDGLRGVNEIEAAVALFPQAHFLALHATDLTRIERLLHRADAFDTMAVAHHAEQAEMFRLGERGDFLPPTAVTKLEQWVHDEQISAADLLAKVKIVRTERENYDPDTAVAWLKQRAPQRTLLMDTERLAPPEIATAVVNQLARVPKS